MKKIVISLTAIGMISFGFAQNANPDFNLSKFRELGMPSSNYKYLNEVQDHLTPHQVKYLEKVASNWDVSTSRKFDGLKGEPFHVAFKFENGDIDAFYDSKGRVVSAIERFSNFVMPKSVGNQIHRQYPNWEIMKNRYSLFYYRGAKTKRSFKVLIEKGNQKKWLRVTPSGDISYAIFPNPPVS